MRRTSIIALCCVTACAITQPINARKSIYHKGWIDFNKNGVMDIYENPKAPILDISQNPRWGRVVECYDEDSFLVGEPGKAMITGL